MTGDKFIQVLDLGGQLQELGARESKLLAKELIDLLDRLSYLYCEGLETLSCIGEEVFDISFLNWYMLRHGSRQ